MMEGVGMASNISWVGRIGTFCRRHQGLSFPLGHAVGHPTVTENRAGLLSARDRNQQCEAVSAEFCGFDLHCLQHARCQIALLGLCGQEQFIGVRRHGQRSIGIC
jgi:hypothetical protein